jgi:effector-binding domain-containing protein
LVILPCGPCLSVYHAGEPEIDVEVCAPVQAPQEMQDNELIHTLPAVEVMATTIHCGPFTDLAGAYAVLLKWIDANDYRIVGADREIYLRLPEAEQYRSDHSAITEMQIPVRRN